MLYRLSSFLGAAGYLFCCIIVFLSGYIQSVYAQQRSSSAIGIVGGFMLGNHSAEFTRLQGTAAQSSGFSTGNGNGFFTGLVWGIPLVPKLRLQTRLLYSSQFGEFTVNDATTEISGGQPIINRQYLRGDFSSLSIEPLLQLSLFRFPLYINAGFQAGYLLGGTYQHTTTRIQKNQSGQELNTQIAASNGDIPDMPRLNLGLTAGLCAYVKISPTLYLMPELSYVAGLTELAPGTAWTIDNLRMGMGIHFILPAARNTRTDAPDIYFEQENGSAIAENDQQKPVLTVNGTVQDNRGNPFANATIIVEDLITGEKLGEYITDDMGHYSLPLERGRQYGFYAIKDGYYPDSRNMDTRNLSASAQTMAPILVLSSIEELRQTGLPVIMYNIFFNYDESTLDKKSLPELLRLTRLLEAMPDLKVQIKGHTSSEGGDDYNKKLSEKRAQAVAEALAQNGISSTRISAIGLGRQFPIMDNNTQDGRQRNRRVEIVFQK